MTETLSSNVPVSGPRIRTLAGVLSNQIAAGEVIERPASVVKELIENSFDAAARRIQIEVEAGGVALVRVRDDGCGIHAEDLKLALSRHATSKIASLSDLERVNSFGFRGEALPSIASVSRLTLASRAAQSDSGFEVVAEGNAADTLRPVALPPGTLVSVRDLFFNTPARRKFLRTERTEFRHLEDVVKRAALCRFDVALSFLHNGKEILRLSPALEPGARSTRVGRVLGQAFAENALEVDIEGPGMTLAGWVGVPEAARAHTDMQYFFINGRAVRDSTARHAVRQALGERLPPGRHPAYVLYLDLDPYQVDVNVHPAKHEVRFREPRLVHDFLWRGLARALEEPNSFSFVGGAVSRMPAQTPGNANDAVPPSRLAPGQERELAEPGAVYRRSGDSGAKLARTPQPPWGPSMAESPLLIAQRYALRAVAGRVAIVDLAETRHAMILRRLGPTLEQGDDISRPLLLPLSVSVKASCADRLEAKFELLAGAGFDLRRSAPAAVTLRAVPACLAHAPASAVFETIIRWIEAGAGAETKTLVEALARTAGERLEDLADDPEAVAALIHFASAHPVEARPRLMLELDASIVADLLRR